MRNFLGNLTAVLVLESPGLSMPTRRWQIVVVTADGLQRNVILLFCVRKN